MDRGAGVTFASFAPIHFYQHRKIYVRAELILKRQRLTLSSAKSLFYEPVALSLAFLKRYPKFGVCTGQTSISRLQMTSFTSCWKPLSPNLTASEPRGYLAFMIPQCMAPPALTETATDEQWSQPFSLLLQSARLLRTSLTDAFFSRNFIQKSNTQEEFESAMNVFDDTILNSPDKKDVERPN
jgi:hypothetical protein